MPLTEELLEPIAGTNPAGDDLRYDPVYDKIKEARREDLDVPTGAWETTRKTADWPLVIRLATDALAKRSKDLQIAAWLTEALLRRDGVAGLRDGLALTRQLLERFWDHLYPEIEDDDLEMRAAPLQWIGLKLDTAVRLLPVDQAGHSIAEYTESRLIPSEEDAKHDSDKREKRKTALAQGKLTPEDWEKAFGETPKSWYRALVADLEGALAELAELDRIGGERFGDVAPNYRPLQSALEELLQTTRPLLARKLELDPDPPEDVAAEEAVLELQSSLDEGAPSDAAPAGSTAGTESAATASPQPVPQAAVGAKPLSPEPKDRDDAAARIAAAARFLRAERPTDPAPFLLLRGFRWGELRGGSDRGIDPRLLAAPPTELRTRLRSLLIDEQWAELLELGEETMAMPYGRGWLDLQRYTLTACAALGNEYDAVANAVRGALRALLQDLPELLSLTLMDDTPAANPETRRWLQDERLLPSGAEAEADPAPVARPAARPGLRRDPFERARDLQRAGQTEQAIQLLIAAAAQETSPRARFLRRTQAASIMVDAGRESVALPILRELVEQIEKHKLEEWEAGETAAEPLGLLYRCLRKAGEDRSTMEALYLRICRLDPLQAIRYDGAQGGGAQGDGVEQS